MNKFNVIISLLLSPTPKEDYQHVDSLKTFLENTLQGQDVKIYPIRLQDTLEQDVTAMEQDIDDLCDLSQIKHTISYFLSEVVCNVEQHAGVGEGCGIAAIDDKNNKLIIGVIDDGVSIFGSYAHAQKYMKEIGNSDAQALFLAQNGFSTKNLPDAENRGYGISSNSDMVVKGLKGSFAILSGNALFLRDIKEKTIIEIPDEFSWFGTAVLAEIPLNAAKINLYDYIQ